MKRYPYSILLALLLTGCSSDLPYMENTGQEEGSALELSTVRMEGNVSTADNQVDGKLGVFLTGGAGYASAAYQYTGKNGYWTSDNPLMLGPDDATICAWYPYDYYIPANSAALGTFPLYAQKYSTESDLVFLSSVSGLNNRNSSLNIRLAHAYALLEFRIQRDATYKGAGSIGKISIQSKKLLSEAKYDILHNTYSGIKIVTELSYNADVTVPAGETITTGMLMLPFTLRGSVTLTMNIDGTDFSGAFPASFSGTQKIGTCYILNVTLRNLQLSITALPPDDTSGGEITW